MIFDPMYFVFMIPGVLLMLWAQSKVKGSYKRWSQTGNLAGLTGAQAARRVLDANGLHDVAISGRWSQWLKVNPLPSLTLISSFTNLDKATG